MLTTILMAMTLNISFAGERGHMLIGEATDHHESLIAQSGNDLYGLQVSVRGHRACQVRAFFQGMPPQTAQFCAGRVTRRHVDDAGMAVFEAGETVNGVAACFDEDDKVGAIRLYTYSDGAVTAHVAPCVTEYRTVWCKRGWTVQGLQLYFDRPAGGLAHAGLVGLRPLCVDSA